MGLVVGRHVHVVSELGRISVLESAERDSRDAGDVVLTRVGRELHPSAGL